jgi:hypothetical protein
MGAASQVPEARVRLHTLRMDLVQVTACGSTRLEDCKVGGPHENLKRIEAARSAARRF